MPSAGIALQEAGRLGLLYPNQPTLSVRIGTSRSCQRLRMRLHRKRRREGTHYVRIPLESFEIEGLIRLKVLPKTPLPRTHRTPSRIGELVTAVTRGALRDSAVSLLSPTQDVINDLRPPGERYK
jgi:hypothetical protein